ncbi:MAG: hypothetical protein RBQ91_00945 [Acholeplasma sp.]|nr:hypothetical protein [Acholeplasma sp.]
MPLICFELFKEPRKKDYVIMILGFVVYMGLLLIIGGFFMPKLDQSLNELDLQRNYVSETVILMYYLITILMVHKIQQMNPSCELFLHHSIKTRYVFGKWLALYLHFSMVVVLAYGLFQLCFWICFKQYLPIQDTIAQISVNAFVFVSFMVLLVRVKSKIKHLFFTVIVFVIPIMADSLSFLYYFMPYLDEIKCFNYVYPITLSLFYSGLGFCSMWLKSN